MTDHDDIVTRLACNMVHTCSRYNRNALKEWVYGNVPQGQVWLDQVNYVTILGTETRACGAVAGLRVGRHAGGKQVIVSLRLNYLFALYYSLSNIRNIYVIRYGAHSLIPSVHSMKGQHGGGGSRFSIGRKWASEPCEQKARRGVAWGLWLNYSRREHVMTWV